MSAQTKKENRIANSTPWRRVLRRIRITAGVTLLIVYCLSVCARLALSYEIEQRLDRLRQAGYPTTMAEFDARYGPPTPDAPGALLYRQAFEKLPENNLEQPYDDGFRLLPERRALLSAYVESGRASLDFLNQAAGIPGARIVESSSDSSGVSRDLHTALRRSRLLLWAEIALRADEGNVDGAVESLMATVALANAARDCASAPCQYARYSLLAGSGWNLCWILNRAALSADQMDRIEAALTRYDPAAAIPMVVSGELCACNHAYDSIAYPPFHPERILHHTTAEFLGELPLMKRIGFGLHWLFWRFTGWHDLKRLMDIEASITRLVAVDPALRSAFQDPRLLSTQTRLPAWLRSLDEKMEPIYRPEATTGTLPTSEMHTATWVYCSRLILAIERYRLAHGALPDSLDQITVKGEEPTRLEESARPIYLRLTQGYMLYQEDPRLAQALQQAARGELAFDALRALRRDKGTSAALFVVTR